MRRRGRTASGERNGAIRVVGARQNNLKNITVEFPLGRITAVTGVSGAGKSSLAFDTLYAEGQRRYVESFSPYARQFMERMDRPDVDAVEGVLPAVAIDRRNAIRTSRSTVGTLTEVLDLLKVLYARAGQLVCDGCGQPVADEEPAAVARELVERHAGRRLVVTFELPAASAQGVAAALEWLRSEGFLRLWVDGRAVRLDAVDAAALAGRPLHVVADRVALRADRVGRVADALEAAMARGAGRATGHLLDGEGEPGELHWSRGRHCARCDRRFPAPVPNHFSFNSPLGACPTCNGFGAVIDVDPDLVVPDDRLSLAEGALRPLATQAAQHERGLMLAYARRRGIPTSVPWRDLSPEHRRLLLEGDPEHDWFGVFGFLKWLETKTYKMHVRVFLSRFRAYVPCPDCKGTRLRSHALLYRLAGRTVADVLAMTLWEARDFFEELDLPGHTATALAPVITELRSRLRTLCEAGVGYLTLDRPSRTLSGGEMERVNLTTAIGAQLVQTLYVLDEPSVGLHPRDSDRLVRILRRLRANRNTIVVVEHDETIVRQVDHIVDLGPGPGAAGGEVVFEGPPSRLCEATDRSATARALCQGGRRLARRPRRQPRGDRVLRVRGARAHNLRRIDVDIPLGVLVAVTGVSGSGKSTLVEDVLYRGLLRRMGHPVPAPGPHDALEGWEALSKVVLVDQSPIGRTPRSNPATYTKAWNGVRKLFAAQPAAKAHGLGPGAFSFNVPGGRCEACDGNGFERIEMQFLSDQYVRCERCEGRRFKDEVLAVRYRDWTVADVLDMTVDEAVAAFAEHPSIARPLEVLQRVGLGYLRLGQPLNTLSGGESQRLKLAAHLGFEATSGTLLLLDEPTTGLHLDDIRVLVDNLHALVEAGNSVVVIEHCLDVVAQADWVVDLGPEGGSGGGRVVAVGTPEAVAGHPESHTGRYLAQSGLLDDVSDSPARVAVADASPAEASYDLAPSSIEVRGARVHNLANIDVDIPRGAFVVVTGRSGSGKSSLAFDVLYAEGQRRFIDCLSPYARQYVAQVGRPDIDALSGVPPTVAITQRLARGGRRSTVATVTEIYHYLRLLYARVGVQHCHRCGQPVSGLSARELVERMLARHAGHRVRLLAPVVRGRKGWHRDVIERARALGHEEVRVDGRIYPVGDVPELARYREHDIEFVLDRFTPSRRGRSRARELVEQALALGDGTFYVLPEGACEPHRYSESLYCDACGVGFDPPDPRLFSYNAREGACATCGGLGVREREDEAEGLPAPCPDCEGTRLGPRARAVKLGGVDIGTVCRGTPADVLAFLDALELDARRAAIARGALAEVRRRCAFLLRVGLDYLSLDRGADTLSGGEAQRVRLAAQLSAQLRGVLYVLDEPTIGLHPADNARLLDAISDLVAAGNSVVVVEHDEDTIRRAQWVVDMGPGGGTRGGRVVAEGPPSRIEADPASPTGEALRAGAAGRAVCRARPVGRGDTDWLVVEGTRRHNLAGDRVEVPLGRFTVVTGVSGSGKSTLVHDVLCAGLRALRRGEAPPAGGTWSGWEAIRAVRVVDQQPIGRTPASTPSTYIGVQDALRRFYAALPQARMRGWTASRFSYNVRGGRCERCGGKGQIRHEMSFLPDVWVPCDACEGRRYNDETLSVRFRGYSIADVLAMTAAEALALFEAIPHVRRPLELLVAVGLDYLQLGQPSHTLSGGEAQRIKLVEELHKRGGRGTLYVLDEPSTGLHMLDLTPLLQVLQRLVDRGDTVVVIEHNLDVVASADWVVDLGPGGGAAGGRVVFQGSLDDLRFVETSATARHLRAHLSQTPARTGAATS